MDLLARGRTRAEFERFAAAHVDGLLRTGFAITGDRQEAEDLVQECLFRLARRWPQVRPMKHRGAYARRVLVNLALDGAPRRTRRAHELNLPAAAISGGSGEELTDGMGRHDTRADLLGALAGLPLRQRTVLVLRYLEDLTEAQVAEMLGCSVGTVKSTASRGLARLRREAGQERPDLTPEETFPQPTKD